MRPNHNKTTNITTNAREPNHNKSINVARNTRNQIITYLLIT